MDLYVQYRKHIHSDLRISSIRNKLLKSTTTKLPEYCMWTEDDLSRENKKERLMWLQEFIRSHEVRN